MFFKSTEMVQLTKLKLKVSTILDYLHLHYLKVSTILDYLQGSHGQGKVMEF